ncbi:MAG: thymidine kinase [Crocinitomicaceae bacterium]|nr:thymidine kinase [Crocinitomicaceae bacterium]
MKITHKQSVNSVSRHTFSTRAVNGKVQVVCGPMFSGKTKTLIGLISGYLKDRKKVVVFKPKLDDRYAEESIVSHDKDEAQAYAVTRPAEMLDLFHRADVIAIDEVQFFDESIVGVCETIADYGKIVVVAGLDLDYLGRPFGSMPQLMSVADEIIKLNSVCTFCSGRARFSHRISKDQGVVVLGEKDKYVPLCRSCYNEMNSKQL